MKNVEKSGLDYITSLWSSVIEVKDAAFIRMKARQLRKDGRNCIKDLQKKVEDDTDLFQDKLETMSVDGNVTSFDEFNAIQKRILLNQKEIDIAKETYFKLFNEKFDDTTDN